MVTPQQVAQSSSTDSPRGTDLLNTPLLNKGTAFTEEERTRFGLQGLLPPHVETLDEQVVRAYEAFQKKDNDLERHIYLRALQDTNEVLFYRLLIDHIEEMTPLVYTPTVRRRLNNLATSIARLADYSSHTRCATQSRSFCGIVLIRILM